MKSLLTLISLFCFCSSLFAQDLELDSNITPEMKEAGIYYFATFLGRVIATEGKVELPKEEQTKFFKEGYAIVIKVFGTQEEQRHYFVTEAAYNCYKEDTIVEVAQINTSYYLRKIGK